MKDGGIASCTRPTISQARLSAAYLSYMYCTQVCLSRLLDVCIRQADGRRNLRLVLSSINTYMQ